MAAAWGAAGIRLDDASRPDGAIRSAMPPLVRWERNRPRERRPVGAVLGPAPVGPRGHSVSRTIGRSRVAEFAFRRATTSNPAPSNIASVPPYALADAIRSPVSRSTG